MPELDEMFINPSCPVCDGENVYVLGCLGNRLHLKCQACGIEFSEDATPASKEENNNV